MSAINDLLKQRVSKPTVGKWSSGFNAVKKYADSNGIPLIGVWSGSGGGAYCQHCENLENACLTSAFKKWMASSGCVFWFGCNGDGDKDTRPVKEDGYYGAGQEWARGGTLTGFPFVRVWWKAGKVDKYDIGDNWIDWPKQTTKGKWATAFLNKLKKLLKNFNPADSASNTAATTATATKAQTAQTAQTINSLVLTARGASWSIDTSSGRFLGYKSPSTGFVDAFQILKDYADLRSLPIAIVWANHGSASVNTIVDDINDGSNYTGDRYTLQLLNQLGANYGNPAGQTNRLDIAAQPGYGFRAGWFQDDGSTGTDCAAARQFCLDIGCSSSLDIMVALYWKYPDGTLYTGASSKNFTTESDLMKFIVAWLGKNTYSQHKNKQQSQRRLSPRKDVFDPNKVYYDYSKNLYNAGDPSRNDNVEIGVWNGNLQKVFAKADSENIPVLVVFGVANCAGHWNTLQSDAFVNWQLSCSMYLSYCYGGWKRGGYSENWLTSATYQGTASAGSSSDSLTYHCPEYAIHWKPQSGADVNIGKYLDATGQTPTGLTLTPESIENFLSGYFAGYQRIDYDKIQIKNDSPQPFMMFGRGATQRVDNRLADKTTYGVCVPYKNLDNIRTFCESNDRPLVAIYFNSSAGGSSSLADALNLDSSSSGVGALDRWLRRDDTDILWCDVANQDGGKSALKGEWHTWIADLGAHPDRALDKWAFRFYLKPYSGADGRHDGVDVSYSFEQLYNKVYNSSKTIATQNFISFLTKVFEPYYAFVERTESTDLFTVDFLDYDNTQIIPQQIVASGHDAVPPEQNPVRAGYTFTGYSQPYTNVQRDLTCTAQYVQSGSSSNKSPYFAEHTYGVGSYQMRVSDNLSAVQVVGDMLGNGMTSQLTSVTFQQNLFQIMPSCFINCERLQNVNITGQTKWIGDYAFCGCRNLRHVNALAYPKQTQINVIGAHAFHGTALTDIAIDLTASYYDTGIGEYAFADCTQLRNVRLTNSAYLGQAAFQGCTALTSVSLPDKSSYAYPETFSGCTSLSSISVPPKVWMLNDGMFRNCTSLTAVELQDYADNRSQLDRLGSEVFDGCNGLSSLVIPSSISSLMQIDENFLRGSSIKKITFNGLSDDVFASKHTEHSFSTINGYVTKLAQAKKVIKDALNRGIPMVLVTCKKSIKEDTKSDCSICKKLAKMLNNKAWLNYVDSNKDKCYFIEASYIDNVDLWWLLTDPDSKNNPLEGVYTQYSTLYAKLLAVYRDSKGKVSKTAWSTSETDVNKLIAQVNKIVSKSSNRVMESTSLSVMVSKFGSPLDYVLAYSSTGAEYKLSSNSQVEKYVAPEVDTVTTSGFKTGVWYYNAKELKQYADDNSIPVFVEFSDYGCTPCTKFRTEIYERQEFQEWVAKQPYLFCRIETKNFGEFNRMATQPYFAKQTWAKGGTVGLPCFIFYWNRPQDPVWDMFGYHDNQIGYQELIDMISQKFKQ